MNVKTFLILLLLVVSVSSFWKDKSTKKVTCTDADMNLVSCKGVIKIATINGFQPVSCKESDYVLYQGPVTLYYKIKKVDKIMTCSKNNITIHGNYDRTVRELQSVRWYFWLLSVVSGVYFFISCRWFYIKYSWEPDTGSRVTKEEGPFDVDIHIIDEEARTVEVWVTTSQKNVIQKEAVIRKVTLSWKQMFLLLLFINPTVAFEWSFSMNEGSAFHMGNLSIMLERARYIMNVDKSHDAYDFSLETSANWYCKSGLCTLDKGCGAGLSDIYVFKSKDEELITKCDSFEGPCISGMGCWKYTINVKKDHSSKVEVFKVINIKSEVKLRTDYKEIYPEPMDIFPFPFVIDYVIKTLEGDVFFCEKQLLGHSFKMKGWGWLSVGEDFVEVLDSSNIACTSTWANGPVCSLRHTLNSLIKINCITTSSMLGIWDVSELGDDFIFSPSTGVKMIITTPLPMSTYISPGHCGGFNSKHWLSHDLSHHQVLTIKTREKVFGSFDIYDKDCSEDMITVPCDGAYHHFWNVHPLNCTSLAIPDDRTFSILHNAEDAQLFLPDNQIWSHVESIITHLSYGSILILTFLMITLCCLRKMC